MSLHKGAPGQTPKAQAQCKGRDRGTRPGTDFSLVPLKEHHELGYLDSRAAGYVSAVKSQRISYRTLVDRKQRFLQILRAQTPELLFTGVYKICMQDSEIIKHHLGTVKETVCYKKKLTNFNALFSIINASNIRQYINSDFVKLLNITCISMPP